MKGLRTHLRCSSAQGQSGRGVGSHPDPLWHVPEEVQHPCAQRAAESQVAQFCDQFVWNDGAECQANIDK